MAATDKTTKALNPKKYFSTSRESVWLGYAETQFLLAEAALRGWAGVADTPEGYYRAGIQASMDYFEISKAEAKSYIDGLMIYQDGQENPFATNNRELALEQIITQKWLAMFPNGNEAWAEFRRTDYPRLRLPLHNLSNDQIAQLVPAVGMTLGFDFSILDVDLPCPGIHSLRMQASADLGGRDRKPEMHNVDVNPSLWGTITFVEE